MKPIHTHFGSNVQYLNVKSGALSGWNNKITSRISCHDNKMPNIMILYERLLLCNENGGNRSNTSINQRRAFTSSSPQMYHRYRAFLYEPSSNKIIRYNLLRQGKAVPLQAGSDPEGSRKLKFPDFVTTAQDGGKVVSLTHRPPLTPEIKQDQ